MVLNAAVTRERLFQTSENDIYLVVHSSAEGSEIVNVNNGKTKRVKQRLPMGYICHAVKLNNETQYLYDVCCSSLNPQEIEPVPSLKLYMYSKLYEKMEVMFSNGSATKDSKIGLGVVVAVGKIAVREELINCSMEFELGSTRVCVYTIIEVIGMKTPVLVKSKPVKLKRRYIETFVTPGGSVLIKTIVKNPCIGQGTVVSTPLFKNLQKQMKFIPPKFNFTNHPFFGKILFSTKMVWSAPTLKVIIGGTLNSNCVKIKSSSVCSNLLIQYRILGIHDSERYLRVPDVPEDMFDSKNFLIKNGVKMWGDRCDVKNNPSNRLHPPQILRKCSIEGRYLSNQFIKHSESRFTYLTAVEAARKRLEKEDDYYVMSTLHQTSRQQM
uniref:Uncharacterized protein n=1 Tax=Panagrolaimus superbus TaxID=310955 RepID=A0A914YSM4_9BILA